jgi:uncharacterized protein (TIGR00106 family)
MAMKGGGGMAIIDLSIVPIGTASTGVSAYVAAIHDVLAEEEGIRYTLTPMSTVIEGDLDKLLAVARKLHEVPFRQGALRVYTTLKIDDRRDSVSTLESKTASVREKLKKQAKEGDGR